MKKQTQRDTNPYKYSDTNKRYQTFDYFAKHTFGGKIARIPLDAGFSCPNKDGTCGVGGCIYCLGGSAAAKGETLREQYDRAVSIAHGKWSPVGYVPYLQANSNTYASPEALRRVYEEAASLPGSVMLAIATRADCLSNEVVSLLAEISEKIPVLVELGLQSVHDDTARLINRGHTYEEFLEGYERLRRGAPDVLITVHLINGLPGETEEMMLESARKVADLRPHMVKLHLLHILKDTPLEKMYLRGEYTTMDRDAYIETAVKQIEVFHPDTVIARITGDAPFESLVAPEWCRRKTAVANDIDKLLFERESYQGRYYKAKK